MSLELFKTAQAKSSGGFAQALAEIERGRKTSHWIWYIFPQIKGLGRSTMAQRYALEGLGEACDYLRDPELRDNLVTITNAVAEQLNRGIPLATLMGSQIDALKLVSSLTLFEKAARYLAASDTTGFMATFADLCEQILAIAKSQGYPRCHSTLVRLEG